MHANELGHAIVASEVVGALGAYLGASSSPIAAPAGPRTPPLRTGAPHDPCQRTL
jgi:hypothetical protein